MKIWSLRGIGLAGCSTSLLLGSLAHAQTQPAADDADASATKLEALQREVQEQAAALDAMKQSMAQQEATIRELRNVLGLDALSRKRGMGNGTPVTPSDAAASATTGAAAASATQTAPNVTPNVVQGATASGNGNGAGNAGDGTPLAGEPEPVGTAPQRDTRPPEVAPIFDQPGVLTPARHLVIEPSFQYGYSSSNRVALVGYTIIPAILIGLIDVREIKTSTYIEALTFRYGLTNRLEIEAKVPYVQVSSSNISRQVFTGTAVDSVFNASGTGLGDVEATLRYQINQGTEKMPYFVGWLRYKSRTGTDPFSVVTDCVTTCLGNTTGTGLPLGMPTGTGFQAIQPGITWLFPSDPAVFFGTFSYLHNFARNNVSLTLLNNQSEFLGKVQAGDIFEFNFGVGLALNEKASFSIGYDQSIIWPTKQNDSTVPGSVRVTLGTLLVGYSYHFNKRVTLNLSVGAGLTRDTPDLQVTLRLPILF